MFCVLKIFVKGEDTEYWKEMEANVLDNEDRRTNCLVFKAANPQLRICTGEVYWMKCKQSQVFGRPEGALFYKIYLFVTHYNPPNLMLFCGEMFLKIYFWGKKTDCVAEKILRDTRARTWHKYFQKSVDDLEKERKKRRWKRKKEKKKEN